MSLPRFHCPFPLTAHQRIELPDAIAHHATRVLRLRHGSDIFLFDGRGGHFPAQLELENKRAWATLGERIDLEAELPVRTVLVQGIAGANKMDWIVEKAVEMGVAQLVAVTAKRSVIQLAGERKDKRVQHRRRIAVSASEQSGRNRLMDVRHPMSLADWLDEKAPELLCVVCDPAAEIPLASAIQDHDGDIALLVGPEGGWSDEELSLMMSRGLRPVRFGTRVLRTETAGIALMAAAAAIKGWN